MNYYQWSRMSEKEKSDTGFCAMIFCMIFIIGLAIWGIIHSQSLADNQEKIKKGEWVKFQLYVCSDRPIPPTDVKNLAQIKEWVSTAKIKSIKEGECSTAVPVVIEKVVLVRSKLITVRWQSSYHKIAKTTYDIEYVPYTFFDKQQDKNDEIDLYHEAMWKKFPNEEKFREVSFQLSIPTVEIYPQLCSQAKIPDCTKK